MRHIPQTQGDLTLDGPMAGQLKGKVALVTGAGRGIGLGIATVLAQRGAAVAVCDLDGATAEAAAKKLAASGARTFGGAADVGDAASIADFAKQAIAELGTIDVCVANAGVIGARGYEERLDFVEEDWDVTFRVNVKGLVNTAAAVAPHMKERRSGKIINIASHSGRTPRGGAQRTSGTVVVPYSVSKAAAIQWTHLLALQLAPFNINVNVVCPGTLWTPMWERIASNASRHNPAMAGMSPRQIFDAQIKNNTPLGRPQTPEDIGRAVAFLASDDAAQITGQALNVNGGTVMS